MYIYIYIYIYQILLERTYLELWPEYVQFPYQILVRSMYLDLYSKSARCLPNPIERIVFTAII